MGSAIKIGLNEITHTYGSPGYGYDYTSLAAWETATSLDLVSLNVSYGLKCYKQVGGGNFDDSVTLYEAITDATHFRRIYPAPGNTHNGTANAGGVGFTTGTAQNTVSIQEDFSQVQQCLMTNTSSSGYAIGILIGCSHAAAINCICYNITGGAYSYGISCQPGLAINCLVYNIAGFGYCYGILLASTAYAYNCRSIYSPYAVGFYGANVADLHKNCNAHNNLTNFLGGTQTTCSVNVPNYIDAGNHDYRLASRFEQGTILSADPIYPFNTDMLEADYLDYWDIGCLKSDEGGGLFFGLG